jgi:CHAT domain-containing protein
VRDFQQHLTAEEIDELVRGPAPAGDGGSGPRSEVRAHVDACGVCRARLQREQHAEATLKDLRDNSGSAPPEQDCPSPERWAAYVSGLSAPAEHEDLLTHASRCDYCGGLLRTLALGLEAEVPDEAALLTSLKSSEQDWQCDLASRLGARDINPTTAQPHPIHAGRRTIWYAAAAAAIAALALIGILRWQQSRVESTYQLLADAYTQDRFLEARIPGARFAPMRLNRGTSRGPSPALLAAELRIQTRLQQSPDAAEWVEAAARAALLERRYPDAIRELQRLLETHPGDPAVLKDLAIGYFERAESEDRPIDYGTAVDYLSQVILVHPNDADAIFNRALSYERLRVYSLAADNWRQYLNLDKRGDWAEEAHKHLERCDQKLQERSSSPSKPPSDDAEMNFVLSDWLAGSRQFDRVGEFARRIESNHGDRWLAALIVNRAQPDFEKAVQELAAAIRANTASDTESAERHATVAALLFAAHSNAAGEIRSRLEQAYAMQRSSRGAPCIQLLKQFLPKLKGSGFIWLEIQSELQNASCSTMTNQDAEAVVATDRAVSLSLEAGYADLYLRSLAFRAYHYMKVGQLDEAWVVDLAGLEAYEQGSYPALRAEQFFYDMMLGAEAVGRWHLAAGLALESARAAASIPNRSFEAIAQSKLAEYSLRTGEREQARQALAVLERIFKTLPQDRSTDSFRLYSATGLAEFEPPENALHRLEQFAELSRELSNESVAARYVRVRSELLLQLGREAEAENLLDGLLRVRDDAREALLTWQDRITWQEETSAALKDLIGVYMRHGNSRSALAAWERGLAAPCRQREFSRTAANRTTARGQRILTYVDAGDRFYLFVQGEGETSAYPLALPPSELRQLARRFAAVNAEREATPALSNHAAQELSRVLLAPVTSALASADTLIFQTSGDLAHISIAALPYQGGYLADRFRIILRPIAGCGREDSRSPAKPDAVLAVAAPALDERWRASFPPLPDAREEATSIQHAFPTTTVLEGRDATTERIEGVLPGSTIFHFAGHSLQRAAGVVLLVAPGDRRASDPQAGMWQASRVNPTLLASCRLAVFSACSTSAPDQARDASPEDVVRAFLAAGVPEVVASLWDVDSAATAVFMRSFYSALAKNLSTAEAIQLAAREVRNHPATARPFYWAAFQLYGS